MCDLNIGLHFQNKFRRQRKLLCKVHNEWQHDKSISSVRALRIFMDMVKRMSNSEKRIYFELWLDMFRQVLVMYFRGETLAFMNVLQPALWELLKTIEDVFPAAKTSKTDLFLRVSARGLEEMEQVCDCKSGSWKINRLVLMGELKLDTKLLGEALIRYGFQYGYDQECYELLCYELLNKNLEVEGVSFSRNFDESILDSGNLRMQLGIELLLALFSDTENNYEGVLRCLWRTRPFPFITGEELFIMLKPHYEGDDPSLQDVCEAYVERNTIFEVPVTTQPRSLMELSKIQIRKTLYEAKGIHDEAIDSLQLPRILKNYLKLGED